ncbi:hypothetical protein VMCG_04302 [Cytospora schulzeri]|uniref:Uncharacterized protein n=1 Tax=Cytospora schulzeri TaxID=448051 RepID=A0A423WSZ8_9PEZI|nr:hypothetical protein VMCG_04302 [Valsa malicola]
MSLFSCGPDVMKRSGQWGKKSANEQMSCMRPRNNGLVDAVQGHIDQVSENLISNATAHVSAILDQPVDSLVKNEFMDCLVPI